jgi:hypothetical protein
MKTGTLKPCPFCGCKEIEMVAGEWLSERCVRIWCTECYIYVMRLGEKIKVAKRKAIDAWNVRVHYTKEPYNEKHHGKRGTG